MVTHLRVATFNLLHGLSLADGVADAEGLRIAAHTLDADIVGLQEVDRCQQRSGLVDQTEIVADALGAREWRFVPALRGTPGARTWAVDGSEDGHHVDGPSYGIGLVSRWPVREWRVLRFPAAPIALPLLAPSGRRLVGVPDEPRVAIAAVVDGPSGPLAVVTAHLSFVPGWNVRQLRRIVYWARDLPGPRLLLGDLNLPGVIPGIVSGYTRLARVPTYPVYNPKVQFDHVLGDGIGVAAVVDVAALSLAVSDHRALVVDLDL
jgi:endonuclease/exonuclease/phosphatase family metal-dependent hydrolase